MTSPNRHALNLERSEVVSEIECELPPPPNPPLPHLYYAKNPFKKSGRICFVHFERPQDGRYVVKAPCLKPTKAKRLRDAFAVIRVTENQH